MCRWRRLPKLTSGAIDLDCQSIMANAERATIVAFSLIVFLVSTKAAATAGGRAAAGDVSGICQLYRLWLAGTVSPAITVTKMRVL